MQDEKVIEPVIRLVLSSERPMPAHFTTDGKRTQTFLVDFEDMSAEDEYQMASNAWDSQPAITPALEQNACLKIGEDVMLGCYILTKLGHKDKVDVLKEEMVSINIKLFPEAMHVSLREAVGKKEVIEYFDFCQRFAIELVEEHSGSKEP